MGFIGYTLSKLVFALVILACVMVIFNGISAGMESMSSIGSSLNNYTDAFTSVSGSSHR